MAKIFGLYGAMTGKVANTVMAVRNGEQIVRKYQPVVANPKSAAQIAARARLKLMSQLSAVFSPAIAIPSVGIVSSRNLFVKKNYDSSSYNDDAAQINLTAVQLTDSVIALPAIEGVREAGSVTTNLVNPDPSLDRVVYVAVIKDADQKLRYFRSSVVERATGGTFETSFAVPAEYPVVIYAYGIRDLNSTARAKFGSLTSPTAEAVAKLIVTRVLTENDIQVTETKAVQVAVAG